MNVRMPRRSREERQEPVVRWWPWSVGAVVVLICAGAAVWGLR
jgi:hypothetical protein